MSCDLFSPDWEARHGAAIALREVFKRHGGGAGLIHEYPDSEELHHACLEDIAVRLLCVFALDRFGDFVSDQVVAPVRETSAQVLGTVLRYMSPASVLGVLSVLLDLNKRGQWEVRHAGLLGIKYLVAVRINDMGGAVVPRVLAAVMAGLSDSDDDVRAVAADTMFPMTKALVEPAAGETAGASRVPEILRTLWDILLDLDDLSASTASVMTLLAEFLSYPAGMCCCLTHQS